MHLVLHDNASIFEPENHIVLGNELRGERERTETATFSVTGRICPYMVVLRRAPQSEGDGAQKLG